MKGASETQEHCALMDWIRMHPNIHKYTIHIANERYLNVQSNPELWAVGSKLKKMGVKKGVSDFFFACPKGEYHGLWLELKAGKNKATKEQQDFINLMTSVGYLAVCVTGCDTAISFIKEYFSLKN
jgi:hypothetical protein